MNAVVILAVQVIALAPSAELLKSNFLITSDGAFVKGKNLEHDAVQSEYLKPKVHQSRSCGFPHPR